MKSIAANLLIHSAMANVHLQMFSFPPLDEDTLLQPEYKGYYCITWHCNLCPTHVLNTGAQSIISIE